MLRRVHTEEEKIAKKLSDLVSNVNLDLDRVGFYLAKSMPNISYRRLEIVIDSAEQERENANVRATHDPLF